MWEFLFKQSHLKITAITIVIVHFPPHVLEMQCLKVLNLSQDIKPLETFKIEYRSLALRFQIFFSLA